MEVIHKTYLPFEEIELKRHFAPVAGHQNPEKYLTYYRNSADRALELENADPDLDKAALAHLKRLGNQMQKDERFWIVTALMKLFHSGDPVASFEHVLSLAIGDTPPMNGFPTWKDALGDPAKLRLFFEVNLPSPPSYKEKLHDRVQERVLVPWILEEATKKPNKALEGATKVDAMLLSEETGFAVAFEAKVLSDASTHIRYDVLRNQIARNIDVLLERNCTLQFPLTERRPELSCFVLITPRIFQDHPESRLYGWLMNEYRAGSGLLGRHLDHRQPEQLDTVPGRLGWLTWEDCNDIAPGTCPWLTATPRHTDTGSAGVRSPAIVRRG
jgi:hypothetical protein